MGGGTGGGSGTGGGPGGFGTPICFNPLSSDKRKRCGRSPSLGGARVEMASAHSCPALSLEANARHLEDYTNRKLTAMNCAAND
jgi:hypothetical protein